MDNLMQLVMQGDNTGSAERTGILLENGESPDQILNRALIPAMDEVGLLFENGAYFIPEMLLAARAMKQSMVILKPKLVDAGIEPVGKVMVATVEGDLHDIGKTLVAIALEGAGFEVIDLGVSVSAARIVEATLEHKPLAIGLSALLTSTMNNMQPVVRAIEAAGLRDKIKIVVGGAPVNADFAKRINADYYGDNPVKGIEYIRSLIDSPTQISHQ